jgi:hypothetical protein
MKYKILIGCIVAVTVLIGVSFTSVVGYRSVESDVKDSPLFNIRSSRAIDKDNGDVNYEYNGEGEEVNLLIPNRDEKTVLFQMAIDNINKMDDEAYDRFISLIINSINWNKFKDIDIDEIEIALYKLRKSYYNTTIPVGNCNSPYHNFVMLILLLLLFGIIEIFIYTIFHPYTSCQNCGIATDSIVCLTILPRCYINGW